MQKFDMQDTSMLFILCTENKINNGYDVESVLLSALDTLFQVKRHRHCTTNYRCEGNKDDLIIIPVMTVLAC